MKQVIPINAIGGGDIAPTITAHYYKAGGNDFTPHERNHIPHIAILEIEMEEPKVIQIANLVPDQEGRFSNPQRGKMIIGYTRDDKGNVQNYHEREIAGTLHTSSGQGGNTDQFIKEQVIGSMQANAMRGSIDGVSPCLTEAMGMGGGQVPMVTEWMSRKDDVAFKEMPDGNIHAFRAHDPRKSTAPEWQITNENNVHPTITSSHEPKVLLKYRIRKLTPTECLRLMGVDDSDIEKMKSAKLRQTLKNGKIKERPMPKTQLYKMAGNSIVVDVLYHIFYQMFIAEPPKPKVKQLSLFDL